MAAHATRSQLHRVTPLVRSEPLSDIIRGNLYLKLDFLQPSGSFKIRGIGNTINKCAENGSQNFVSSSGGNAGLAAAYACRQRGFPITVVVPQTTKSHTRDLLRGFGASVIVHGTEWNAAHRKATDIAKKTGAHLVHPFDDPHTWRGHATVVHEIFEQWKLVSTSSAPDTVVTVCGGGGLLMGIMQGLDDVGWNDVPVVVCETSGAASFAAAMKERKLVELERIETVATSLGAKAIAPAVFDAAMSRGPRLVHPYVMSDRAAIEGCVALANCERMLVEPACGAAVAYVLANAKALEGGNVVVEICGGSGTSLSLIQSQCEAFGVSMDDFRNERLGSAEGAS